VARRAESQEACFLAGGDYRAFLERQGLERRPGAILDERGVELGRHDGVWRFTPGQRRGLGLAAAAPLYALRVDNEANAVVVGPRSALACTAVSVRGSLHLPVDVADAKLRYRSDPVRAHVEQTADGFRLQLEEPAFAVAPGQIAALYADDAVVGAGEITAAA
jgi:tRNA-specific 2-thiouridylase